MATEVSRTKHINLSRGVSLLMAITAFSPYQVKHVFITHRLYLFLITHQQYHTSHTRWQQQNLITGRLYPISQNTQAITQVLTSVGHNILQEAIQFFPT